LPKLHFPQVGVSADPIERDVKWLDYMRHLVAIRLQMNELAFHKSTKNQYDLGKALL
jgi:hypothetical protein